MRPHFIALSGEPTEGRHGKDGFDQLKSDREAMTDMVDRLKALQRAQDDGMTVDEVLLCSLEEAIQERMVVGN